MHTPSSLGKKLMLSFGVCALTLGYVMGQNLGGSRSVAILTPTISTLVSPTPVASVPTNIQPIATSPSPTPLPIPTPAPTPPKPAGLYVDGSYTGVAADAYYGTVQVKAVIQNGRLTDVQFLQYPSDRSTSRAINSQAMPMLTQEALQVQSAQVDGVSGATFTSQAFQQSLAGALALAKN